MDGAFVVMAPVAKTLFPAIQLYLAGTDKDEIDELLLVGLVLVFELPDEAAGDEFNAVPLVALPEPPPPHPLNIIIITRPTKLIFMVTFTSFLTEMVMPIVRIIRH